MESERMEGVKNAVNELSKSNKMVFVVASDGEGIASGYNGTSGPQAVLGVLEALKKAYAEQPDHFAAGMAMFLAMMGVNLGDDSDEEEE